MDQPCNRMELILIFITFTTSIKKMALYPLWEICKGQLSDGQFRDINTLYMLFTGLGRSVLGKTVPSLSSTARGHPRPQAEGRTRDGGHSFSQYGPTKAGEEHFYLFLNYESKIQTHCVVLFSLFVWVIKFAFTVFVRIHCFFYEKVEQ